MTDLDLVPTQNLIAALLARFSAAVLVGERPHEIPSEGIVLRHCGDVATAKGWCEFASDILTDELRLQMKPEEPEEEPTCSP
jgi:hypothetical protein